MLINVVISVVFFLIGFLFSRKNKSKEVRYLRRGIYTKNYTVTENGIQSQVDCQFELGELERTSTKSKVSVISVVPNRISLHEHSWKDKFIKLVNNTWIDSIEIDWIEDDLAEKRNQKIDELLNERDKV